jgi:hypothetical protein
MKCKHKYTGAECGQLLSAVIVATQEFIGAMHPDVPVVVQDVPEESHDAGTETGTAGVRRGGNSKKNRKRGRDDAGGDGGKSVGVAADVAGGNLGVDGDIEKGTEDMDSTAAAGEAYISPNFEVFQEPGLSSEVGLRRRVESR